MTQQNQGPKLDLDAFIKQALDRPPAPRGRPKKKPQTPSKQPFNKRPQQQQAATEPKRLTAAERLHIQRMRTSSPRWRSEAVVMIWRQGTCTSCHAAFSMFEPNLFLRKWHPQFGLHYERLTREQAQVTYCDFPHREEQIPCEVSACPQCFEVGSHEGPFAIPLQPELPFEPPIQPRRTRADEDIPELDHTHKLRFARKEPLQ